MRPTHKLRELNHQLGTFDEFVAEADAVDKYVETLKARIERGVNKDLPEMGLENFVKVEMVEMLTPEEIVAGLDNLEAENVALRAALAEIDKIRTDDYLYRLMRIGEVISKANK